MTEDSSFQLAGRTVGRGHPVFVVGEVAQAHDGSLGTAHAFVDAVAAAGCDAVKFQTHIAGAESTPREQFRVMMFPQDATRYDYWRRTAFTPEQWAGLARHAEAAGLVFLSTPFSGEALELLDRLGTPAWKIGSGEVSNLPLVAAAAATGKPVLLSSGMSPWAEIDAAVAAVRAHKAPLAVLQCTTSYPCPAEQLGLNVIGEIGRRYRCPAGFSDHSGTVHAGLAAVTLGASLLEVHVTFSRHSFGPDVAASLTVEELGQLVEGVRFVGRAFAHPVDKDAEAAARTELRTLFGKSIVAAAPLAAGTRLEAAHLALKKPAGGIPAARLEEVLGRIVLRPYDADEFILEADLE